MLLKERWRALLAVAFIVACAVFVCWRAMHVEQPTAPVEVRRELAEERIPQIEAQSKATRRATRARIDQEAQRDAGDSDLVGYLGSRSGR